MIEDVTKEFNGAIRSKFAIKPEILKFLLNHPRKAMCLENLCREIQICEKRALKIGFNIDEYKMLIRDIAFLFAERALKLAEEQAISSIERIRRETENNRIENAKETLKEYEGGIFKDIIEP